MAGDDRARQPLLRRSPALRRLVSARAVSLLGDGIGTVAVVIHVKQARGTGTAVGALLVATAAHRLLSPLTGTLADRVDQRRLLAVAELGQGVLVGMIAVWLPALPVLLALVFGKALLATTAEPAGRSAIPVLVASRDLPAANALLSGLREAGEVAGPLLGGMLVAVVGVRWTIAVDAVTFLVSVPLLLRLPALPPEPDTAGGASTGWLRDARHGVRALGRSTVTRALTVGFALLGLGAADDVALPFLARVLGGGDAAVGALYAAVGAGLLVGYAVLGRTRRVIAPARAFLVGALVTGVGNAFTGLAPSVALAVVAQAVRGLGIALVEVQVQTLVQRSVPRAVMGRVFANLYGVINVTALLGLVAGGPLLDATSARTVLVIVGVTGMAADRPRRRGGRGPAGASAVP